MNQHTPHPFVSMDDPAPSAEVAVDMAINQVTAGLSALVQLRCRRESAEFVPREEGKLFASLQTHQWLLSDLYEARTGKQLPPLPSRLHEAAVPASSSHEVVS